jgi:hypothetical protein
MVFDVVAGQVRELLAMDKLGTAATQPSSFANRFASFNLLGLTPDRTAVVFATENDVRAASLVGGTQRVLARRPAGVENVNWDTSPADCTRIVATAYRHNERPRTERQRQVIQVWHDGAIVYSTEPPEVVRVQWWSDRELALVEDKKVYLINADTGERRQIFSTDSAPVR